MTFFQKASFGYILFFLICVALQYNDPDPMIWVNFYLCGALGGLFVFRKPKAKHSNMYLAAQFSYCCLLLVRLFLVNTMELNPGGPGEFYSELGGILIMASWLFFLRKNLKA